MQSWQKTSRFIKWIVGVISLGLTVACAHQGGHETMGGNTQSLHERILVLDAHADIALPSTNPLYLSTDGSSKVSPPALQSGGVGAVVMSVAVGPGPGTAEDLAKARALADEKLESILAVVAKNESSLSLATTVQEIETARAAGKTAIILGLQNGRLLEGILDALDEFHTQGVRVFGLVHLGHNQFADSSRPLYDGTTKTYEADAHGGLSDKGVAAIKKINALGGIVDVSQMSKAATLQTIALSRSPVIASHSNVNAITSVTRNLSNAEIDAIGETGGVIHIVPFGAYLVDLSKDETQTALKAVRVKHGLPEANAYPYELYWELPDPAAQKAFIYEMRATIGSGSLEDMMDHIDYVVNRIGIDHVGIGSDFNHGSGIEDFKDASEAMNVTEALIKRGYSDDDIAKIWSGNFLRVLEKAHKTQRK